MKYDKEKLRQSLSLNDVTKILTDLGSDSPIEDRQGNPMFQTICHGGHSHKLYYYDESKLFHCYTDCGESFNIFDLVMKVQSCSFPQAIEYVAKLSGRTFGFGTLDIVNNELISDWGWLQKFDRKIKKQIELPIYDEKVLDVFLPYPHEEWINEGISYETMKKYEIGYYIKDERITIPHRSIDNQLVGIRGRAMRQEDIDNKKKYMPLSIQNQLYNHPTMFNLYGIHKTKDAIKRLKKVAIFESEKSVLKCEDYYGDDNFTTACCGSNISTFQRDMLLSLGVEEVFIGLDKMYHDADSEEAYEYAEKILKIARKFAPFVRTLILWDEMNLLDYKSSPVDKGKEVLETLMKYKYEIKTVNEVEV